MREIFSKELLKYAKKNKDIFLLTGDLGYGMWNQFRDDLPDQFYNVGASEQSMMGIAVGLALNRKIPFVYSITNFLLYRPFETIRNYIDHEQIPVRLVGSGRDKDYKHDGFSHDSSDAKRVLQAFSIQEYWPKTKEEISQLVKIMVETDEPAFISLRR